MALMLASIYGCAVDDDGLVKFLNVTERSQIMSETEVHSGGGPVILAGAGRRSVQVVVYNHVDATLTVSNVDKPNDCEWMDGEVPTKGYSLQPQDSVPWGVDNPNSSSVKVYGTVELSGFGDAPLSIYFYNDKNGKSGVEDVNNGVIQVTHKAADDDNKTHTRFNVYITLYSAPGPIEPPVPPKKRSE